MVRVLATYCRPPAKKRPVSTDTGRGSTKVYPGQNMGQIMGQTMGQIMGQAAYYVQRMRSVSKGVA